MRCVTGALALWATVAATTPAAAAYVTVSSTSGFQLGQACKASATDLAEDFCTGYVLGAMDRLSVEKKICPSGEAVTGRVLVVARKYLADHPERWGLHPLKLVEDALVGAFPCVAPPGKP